jgi:capsular exopolysaccharide synthesis family protein
MTEPSLPTVELRTSNPWTEYGAQSFVPQERHLLDYLRVLSKRRWTAIPTFAAVVAAVMIPSMTMVPIYEATTKVLIDGETQNIVMFKEVVEQEKATADYFQTQYQILGSRAVARATIDKLGLWDHPQLAGGPPDTAAAKPAPAPSSAAPANEAAGESAAQSRTVDRFLANLTISPIRNSRIVDVKYRSTDAAFAAAAANALASTYMERNLQFKFDASKDAADWLTNQLDAQRKNVEQTELALQRYREQNNAASTDDPEVTQRLSGLNAAAMEAKTTRLEKEAALKQLRAIQHDRKALAAAPAIVANSGVQRLNQELADLQRQEAQLSRQYGERHPEMIKVRSAMVQVRQKLDAELLNAVQAVEGEYVAAQAREESLTRELEAQKAEVLAINRKSIGYAALERDAASNRQIFEALLQRAKETGISSELKTNNIRIADPADVPRVPISPNKQRDLLFGIMVGLVIGVAAAFVFEYLDNKIKSPPEIRSYLNLPCLGLVPKIGAKDSTPPLLNNGVPDSFAEAFRAVRSNVLFSVSNECRRLVVTSTAPREGKSVVASNLAAGLAMAGHRVVLIDADMRRPRVHAIFGVDVSPGLSQLIVGSARAEVIRRSKIPNLWIVPAGEVPPNPAELLSSQQFEQFLTTLSSRFDWVILDAPPVLAVTDASIVAHSASGVVFVASADTTDRNAAVQAVSQLRSAKANFLGVVLNRVNLSRNAFFYAPYYRREYTEYYSRALRS